MHNLYIYYPFAGYSGDTLYVIYLLNRQIQNDIYRYMQEQVCLKNRINADQFCVTFYNILGQFNLNGSLELYVHLNKHI